MDTCAIDGCERGLKGRGYCNRHYKRLMRYGDPLAGGVYIDHGTTRLCDIPDCGAQHYANGLCGMHYTRNRTGKPAEHPRQIRSAPGCSPPCKVENCKRPSMALGLCIPHYQRASKGLDLEPPIKEKCKTIDERFAAYAEPSETGCLLWTGAIANGYGSITVGPSANGGRLAHRVAYERATGEKLKPYEAVHHICAVRNCVEPTHLQKVSTVENGVEMLERNWYIKRIAELEQALAEIDADSPLLDSESVA